MLDQSLLALLDSKRLKLDSKVLLVVTLGKVITVIDDAISSEYVDLGSNAEIFGRIELLFGHVHAGVIGLDWLFGEFLFF